MQADYDELLEQSNRTLCAFLDTELDLGSMLANIAKVELQKGNLERCAEAKRKVRAALETVERFKARLPREMKQPIERRAAELKKLISTL